MELGKSLLGGLIGAAVGIGILAAAYLTPLQLQGMWLAIPVAIATGMGVRMMVATKGHASIVRGAMTLALALVAYLGGWWLVAGIASNRPTAKAPRQPAAAEKKADAAVGDDAEEPAEAAPPKKAESTAPARAADRRSPRVVAPGTNPLDFLWLGIAALIAYELGRGTGFAPTASTADGGTMTDPALNRGADPASPPPQVIRPPD